MGKRLSEEKRYYFKYFLPYSVWTNKENWQQAVTGIVF
mgnify:CR=1 FL=1